MTTTNIIAVVAVILASTMSLKAQQGNRGYDYPVKPGTAEWKALQSHSEMLRVCQIPEATLNTMSTTDLIEACLNYPLYGDMFAFDEFQRGFASVTAGFNGLQELLTRKDSGPILFEKYKAMEPSAFEENWELERKGEYAARFYSVEILLSQDAILGSLQGSQRTSLLQQCIQKASMKGRYPEVYGILSFGNLAFMAGRIMLHENFIPFGLRVAANEKLKMFLQDAFLPDSSLVSEILDYAVQGSK